MQPPTPARSIRRRRVALTLAASVLVLSACGVQAGDKAASVRKANPNVAVGGATSTTTSEATTTTTLPATDLDIQGSDGSKLNDVIGSAIEDLQDYWKTAFPKAYDGAAYEPLSGGLYAIDSSQDGTDIPCSSSADVTELMDNAFYCPPSDAVVWDQERFMPQLAKEFGTFTVAIVIAHEWGHVIQERAQFEQPSVITELQADCFAGSWAKHVAAGDSSRFEATNDDVDEALAGVLALRDAPGGTADDPMAHGSGFDRVGAFEDGFDEGVTRCAQYRNGDPTPYQFPFTDQADYESGGDMKLSGTQDDPGIEDLTFPSLDAYWTKTFPAISGGKEWDPLGDPIAYSSGDEPDCGGQKVTGYLLFVCIPDRYVGFEQDETMQSAYEQDGDFAVAALFATQYGLDVVDQLGSADDEVSATLQGDCFAGAWASALLPPDPPEDYQLVLSPGDLDEGVKVLLTFRSDEDRKRQGPGFARVAAFRKGVIRGPEACKSIKR
ncbi:MAG: neutral zinc metallopeptidase [Acidimicrobiales bacterium]